MISKISWTSQNEFKAAGPDRIHPRLLKEQAAEIPEPLAILFAKN